MNARFSPLTQDNPNLDDCLQSSGAPALVCGGFNLDASRGAAADALHRANLEDALSNRRAPTKPHSFFEPGKVIDWIFARRPMRSSEAQVHRSVSVSDYHPLSAALAFT